MTVKSTLKPVGHGRFLDPETMSRNSNKILPWGCKSIRRGPNKPKGWYQYLSKDPPRMISSAPDSQKF